VKELSIEELNEVLEEINDLLPSIKDECGEVKYQSRCKFCRSVFEIELSIYPGTNLHNIESEIGALRSVLAQKFMLFVTYTHSDTSITIKVNR